MRWRSCWARLRSRLRGGQGDLQVLEAYVDYTNVMALGYYNWNSSGFIFYSESESAAASVRWRNGTYKFAQASK